MPFRSDIRYRFEYAGLQCLCAGIRFLPPAASLRFGRWIGSAARYVLPGRIRLAHDNLAGAFGNTLTEAQRHTIIHKLLKLLGEAFIESVIFTSEDVQRNITIEGKHFLERAKASKNGAIFLVPHFGMWELASFTFGAYLVQASVIYKPLKNPYIDRSLIAAREKSGLELIPSKQALRRVLGNLKKGRAVGILFDQNAGRSGVPATFFGKTASTYGAPAVFALKTGCPVFPAYMMPDHGFRRHRLIIGEPFPLINTGNREHDILANTQQYNDFLEALVRRYPELWFGWLHRRWKLPRSFAQVNETI
ncbi:MAG: lysophospholipid acyltransferase family protein [Desulfobacterota bacterium]|nr:lysophospholipid acyltransferase family protein [Thermodesulfobacteriota bacterium]